MQQLSFVQRTGAVIRSRRPGFWILLLAGVVLVVGGISVWTTYGLVRLSYDTPSGADGGAQLSSRLFDTSSQTESPLVYVFGLVAVPREDATIKTVAGNSETLTVVGELPWFGVKELTVTLTPTRTAQKIRSGGLDCSVINASGIYSYDCTQPGAILRYQDIANGRWRNAEIRSFYAQYGAVRYQDGLLAVGYHDPVRDTEYLEIAYIVPGSGKTVTLPLPENMQLGETTTSKTIVALTDTTNPSNKGFVLYDYTTGDMVYYADFSRSATTKSFKRRQPINLATEVSACTLQGTTVACYNGQTSLSSDEGVDGIPGRTAIKPGTIEVTDLGTDQPSTTVYTGQTDFGIDSLFVTKSGTLYALSAYKVYRINLQNEQRYTASLITEGTDRVEAGADLYYLVGDSLYQYDEVAGRAALVYDNQKQALAGVSVYGNDVLMNIFEKNDPARFLYVYRLNEPAETGENS